MANGYWGRILRVNLSTQEISVDEHDEKFYRTYLGGKGIVAHYLMKEVPAGCDPLGPDNVLVFAASILTGTAIPGAARNSAGANRHLPMATVKVVAIGVFVYVWRDTMAWWSRANRKNQSISGLIMILLNFVMPPSCGGWRFMKLWKALEMMLGTRRLPLL